MTHGRQWPLSASCRILVTVRPIVGGAVVDIDTAARRAWCYGPIQRANVSPEITLSEEPWKGLGRRS
jgi:hypothetical protein